jgi:hypothetical protein
VFVAKYSATGVPLFAEPFEGTGGGSSPTVTGLSVDTSGEMRLSGIHYDGVDFGDGPLSGMGAFEVTLDDSAGLVSVTSQLGLFPTTFAGDSGGGGIVGGFAQSATAFDVDTCTIDSQNSPWPVLYRRLGDGSVDWVRSYEILAGVLAVPWRIVSNAAGRTAVLFVFGGLNQQFTLDLGGNVTSGRFAVLAIDP